MSKADAIMADNAIETPPEAHPAYGGNKIPADYLRRFLPSQGRLDEHGAMPTDLKYFLDEIE